jgi:hypothetical protein
MKKFLVTFVDEIEAVDEEEAYDKFREYLTDCAVNEDVTAFRFEEIKKETT